MSESDSVAPRPLRQLLLSEFVATMLLLVAVIGSGLMAERLADGNIAIALLANTLATAGALYFLIEVFGPLSGAHMNPAVSLGLAVQGRMPWPEMLPYALVQGAGAICGAWLAHAMFEAPILQWSTQVRSGHGQWLAEAVATAGLVLVVLRASPQRVAAMVAAYIGAAYWFTASTSFANPAVTLGRILTDSFAGIAPASAPGFVLAQCVGLGVAIVLHRALGDRPETSIAPDAPLAE